MAVAPSLDTNHSVSASLKARATPLLPALAWVVGMDKQDERKKPHGKTDPKRGDIMKRIIKDLTGGGNDGGGGGASDGGGNNDNDSGSGSTPAGAD